MFLCRHCGLTVETPFIREEGIFCCERCYLRSVSLREAYRRLEGAYRGTMEALVAALDARECETHRHSERVAKYARFLAENMGVKGGELEDIYRGALLHDIGKIGVPDAILLKPASLTEEEWTIMKKHPEIGERILLGVAFLKPAAELVLSHEERFDGAGYPRRLRGEEIPLGARIFAVMDALDAMAFDRPYRKGMPFEAAVAEIRRGAGAQFDPKVVEVFGENAPTLEGWVRQDRQEVCEPHGKHQGPFESI
jgi:HD-GYP domain-containing protein (c-di-GMP phosphodiesterase class II)